MVSYARQAGVYAFWGDRPVNNSVDIDLHWPDELGQPFVYRAGDTRCVLLDTKPGLVGTGAMFARMEPCHKRAGDGVVCEAATAFPPPPAFGFAPPDQYYRAPAPPPPPFSRAQSRLLFVKEQIRPRTHLICSGIEEGPNLRQACRDFANYLVTPRSYGFIPIFQPYCERSMCFHSCDGAGGTDTEGFHNCKEATCADTPCLDFLTRECPSGMVDELADIYTSRCTLRPPAPPPPPASSPPPPTSAPALPPTLPLFVREAARETEYDANCQPISYSLCQEVVRRFAREVGAPNAVYSDVLDVSVAPCEGLESDDNCFIGALPAPAAAPRVADTRAARRVRVRQRRHVRRHVPLHRPDGAGGLRALQQLQERRRSANRATGTRCCAWRSVRRRAAAGARARCTPSAPATRLACPRRPRPRRRRRRG